MRRKNDTPEVITLSSVDLDGIESRILSNMLSADDKKIILTILTTYQWIQTQLRQAKFSMLRLRNLFGFKKEEYKKLTNTNNTNVSTDLAQQSGTTVGNPPKK